MLYCYLGHGREQKQEAAESAGLFPFTLKIQAGHQMICCSLPDLVKISPWVGKCSEMYQGQIQEMSRSASVDQKGLFNVPLKMCMKLCK